MSDSLRERIVQAVLTKLNTGTPSGVPDAKRAWTTVLNENQLPMIAVYWPKDDARPIGGPQPVLMDRTLTLAVGVWFAGNVSTTADQLADAALQWIVSSLSGQEEAGLYELMLEDGTECELAGAEVPFARVTVHVTVKYQTAVNRLDVRT